MKSDRLQELDALRGIAAVAVVLFHYFTQYHKNYGHSFDPSELFRLGYHGVHLFFMVSGFVIFWTLNRSRNALDFTVSRFSRLYPAFWVAVLLTFVTVSLIGPADRAVDVPTLLANLTMFHEYAGFEHVDGVYWTLTIELTFYILAGVAFKLRLLRFIDRICLAWIGLAIALHTLDRYPLFYGDLLLLKWCHLFAAGIAFYRLWNDGAQPLPILVIVASMAANLIYYELDRAVVINSFYLVFAGVVLGWLRFLAARPLVWLGSISYTLYLLHQHIGYGVIQNGYQLGLHPAVSITVALVLSLVLASLLTKHIEGPACRIIRSRWKSRKIFLPRPETT